MSYFQRILVIGCSGSGKSVFSRRLASITHLPLYHLDLLWHKADRSTISREEFDLALEDILARERWIMDGNFQRTLARRLTRSQAVFLFELPLADCLAGVERRIGQERPDMPWVETEFDPEFRQWIVNFQKDRLPGIKALLASYSGEVIIFTSHQQADEYLEKLQC